MGSEQSRWVCTAEAVALVGAAGGVAAAVGVESATNPADIRAAAESTAVAARRVRPLARLAGFDCNELPSMGGRIPEAWDVATAK
ncbi:hypothetical protein [Streptomyces sp. NPDC059761]|uniref:hypothetical protein n=1 Tax=Streptomyces sp. NPDC059761 TaxID=3346937 RepID=UPI003656411A